MRQRAAALGLLALLGVTMLMGLATLAGGARPALAAGGSHGAEVAAQSTTPPEKLRQLIELMNDPEVRRYLAERRSEGDLAPPPRPDGTMASSLGNDLQRLRDRIGALALALPNLPEEFGRARGMLADALGAHDISTLGLYMVVFVALGFGGELVFRLLTRRSRHWLLGLSLQSARERVWAVFARLVYGLGLIGSFAACSIGGFLLFQWSPLLKEILLGYLIATVIVRLTAVFGRFLLAPNAIRFRVVPLATPAAAFLFRRGIVVAVLVAFGWQTISLLGAFGFSQLSRELSSYALGVLVLAIGLEAVWRVPREHHVYAEGDPTASTQREFRRSNRIAAKAGVSLLFILLWSLSVAQADMAFWIVAFAAGLPAAVVVLRQSIRHILRTNEDSHADDVHRLEVIFVERGLRSLLIVVGALTLGKLLGLDFVSLTMQDTLPTRVMRGILSVTIIVLVADFLWHVIRVLVDRKLARNLGVAGTVDESGHAARLQTLLPILKNLLLAVLAVIAAMMVLAALGVEIGPLIASAGVVGVAIGFGAQTLVRDIISGVFYLIDDAFRVGEYIQSGTYKGTVESFSLRSVKLRHQRGALYTVPFGILGAVQNQSRDWVVDKITINVPYNTDLDKVRKIVKRIGEALLEDPDFGPEIIKPIKLQGVAQFGDYAIQLQTKMMTKPGDVQFAARRRALIMIKQAFEANDIGFALPMVHVAGEGGNSAVAARQGLALVQAGKVSEAR